MPQLWHSCGQLTSYVCWLQFLVGFGTKANPLVLLRMARFEQDDNRHP